MPLQQLLHLSQLLLLLQLRLLARLLLCPEFLFLLPLINLLLQVYLMSPTRSPCRKSSLPRLARVRRRMRTSPECSAARPLYQCQGDALRDLFAVVFASRFVRRAG